MSGSTQLSSSTHRRRLRRVCFLGFAIAFQILPCVAALSPGGGDVVPPGRSASWYQQALVGLEVGPTGAQFGSSDVNDRRYCSRFDGHELVRNAVAANCEYLVVWARDGDYAYYQSKMLPVAPGLGSRDPLREAMDAARGHRLPIVAYCVVQQGGHFLKAHPEWEMRGPDGKPIGRFCYNSGYLEAMKQIVDEQAAYGIAGFHIDMVDQGFGPPYGCWCDVCRDQFQKEFGQPMPKEVSWDEAWDRMLEFRYRTSGRFEKALYAHLKAAHPKVTVDFNYHGNPPFSFEVGQRPVQHAGNGDFITGETGVWGFSALTVGLNAAFYQAAAPGQRVQVAMQRGVRMYHDQTVRPLNDMRWELFTLLAHGAFVTVVDKTGLEGQIDPITYGRIGSLFQEARVKQAHFGQESVAEVGLYFSARTRDWVGRTKPADYFQSFLGAHKTMVYEHIPYGVLLDENLSLERVRRFPVVVLPNVGILSDREIAILRQYVEQGGQLVVTGESGVRGWRGERTARSSLEGLIGARLQKVLESTDNWVRMPRRSGDAGWGSVGGPPVHDAKPSGESHDGVPFLVRGPACVYEPAEAVPVGELLQPHRVQLNEGRRYPSDWPLSPDAVVGPAVLLRTLGEGRVLTIAASPDWAVASDHSTVEARKLLADAVRMLRPQPRVRIAAPTTVEAIVTDDPATRTLRVHLIGYNAPPQTLPPKDRPYVLPGLIEDLPAFRARVEFSERLKKVTALNPSTRLKRRGQQVDVEVEDVHEVIQCRY